MSKTLCDTRKLLFPRQLLSANNVELISMHILTVAKIIVNAVNQIRPTPVLLSPVASEITLYVSIFCVLRVIVFVSVNVCGTDLIFAYRYLVGR